MKFTRLRLSGFKSFVDHTELYIEPGLTGVVGPNGCGKSNLLEAMRWVMGENRPTSMRGSGMDDVIFGGTNARPMRNNAEVTLYIDNSDRSAPAPYNEFDVIEVTRRIEREAGSIYRINGREVRQRDVQIFFADASTGSASPALVRQGQISILINQKPLARRAILEEAAGISGLHQRRHEAELRLKAAETNLGRLNDIIAEVEGQLQGLRRQARQAARYRNLSGLIHKAEALLFHLRWQDLESLAKAAGQALDAAAVLVTERTEAAAQASTRQVEAAAALPPLRDTEAVKGAALQRLLHERNALDAEEARAREEAQRLRQRIGTAEQDSGRESALEQDAISALADFEGESQELEAANAGAAEKLTEAEEAVHRLSEALATRERELDRLTAELAQLNATRASYERARHEGTEQANRADAQRAALQPRAEAALAEIAQTPDVAEAEARVETMRANVATSRAAAEHAETEHSTAAENETRLRCPLEAAERDVQRLDAEIRALANLLRPQGNDLWPPLIDALKVQPGYESALAAALGDDLDAPLDEAAPQHWRDLEALAEIPPLPAGTTLANFVEAPHALARRLAYTGVVTLEEGSALQKDLRPGQRLVSQRGDLWRWDGYAASADAPSQAAIRLKQRNRLEALEHEAVAAKEIRANAHAAYADAQREAATANETSRAASRSVREAEAALIAAQDEAARAARLAAERAGRLATLEAEIKACETARENARRAAEAATDALAAMPDGTALARDLNAAREEAADARTAASEARANLETIRREALARGTRLATIAEEITRWSARRSAAQRQMETLAERIVAMQEELNVLEAAPAEIATRRSALMDAIDTAEAARKEAADARATAETELASADRLAKSATHALTEAREERAACEARAESATARLHELATRIRDELSASPEELFERAELKPDSELPPLDQAEKRVEKLKAEREQLGGVNLRAEEEALEHEQRMQALIADREDLDGAIQRLRRGIQSLNKEGRERLRESFDKVNANFERLFKELFQGGEARLTFTESEDPLEAGLEILAKPPGKKLTTLSLLSGGEQALTAISLIFAVFLVNPAPICVLDEVDAPLDDANVDRFCRLLDEMTRLAETRYMIITHHALTMSRMDRLFGVTMAERGVSQLVSVSLNEAERVIAAE
ncbi:MAG TPA: chromosome segregation protein SMC [Micropepsaceae bacterium]|nr:chromosome segregation protein SMC [Micropepsaceae bacterium]